MLQKCLYININIYIYLYVNRKIRVLSAVVTAIIFSTLTATLFAILVTIRTQILFVISDQDTTEPDLHRSDGVFLFDPLQVSIQSCIKNARVPARIENDAFSVINMIYSSLRVLSSILARALITFLLNTVISMHTLKRKY